MLSSEHRTIKLPDGVEFFAWAGEHWPAPRRSVELDPWQLAPEWSIDLDPWQPSPRPGSD